MFLYVLFTDKYILFTDIKSNIYIFVFYKFNNKIMYECY